MNIHTASLNFADLQSEIVARPNRIEEKGYSGMTPLIFSCWNKNSDVALLLLKSGANVHVKNNVRLLLVGIA